MLKKIKELIKKYWKKVVTAAAGVALAFLAGELKETNDKLEAVENYETKLDNLAHAKAENEEAYSKHKNALAKLVNTKNEYKAEVRDEVKDDIRKEYEERLKKAEAIDLEMERIKSQEKMFSMMLEANKAKE